MTLSERMKSWREKKKLTIRDAGQKLGVSHTTVMNIERGQVPQPEIVQKLAAAWNVKPWHKLYASCVDSRVDSRVKAAR